MPHFNQKSYAKNDIAPFGIFQEKYENSSFFFDPIPAHIIRIPDTGPIPVFHQNPFPAIKTDPSLPAIPVIGIGGATKELPAVFRRDRFRFLKQVPGQIIPVVRKHCSAKR